MEDGLQPEMQGSTNPLILRNYRMIPPLTWKYYNLWDVPAAFPGQHVNDRDIPLVFKVEAAPVVLPYESELVLKFTFLKKAGDGTEKRISNQWAPKPLYRVKAKSIAHIIKRCWATISNMTFQSYKPPYYLNEILLRKPAPLQMKYPDNYTGEKSIYLNFNPSDPQSWENAGIPVHCFLEPLTRSCPNEGQLYFMTPQFIRKKRSISGTEYYENTLSFRIPLTELLPVFKIGVIPLIMIASNSFDMWVDIHNPKDWFVDYGIGEIAALETYLNVTTVSFPDINPLAEALIRPRIFDGRFIAPFLDYLTFENTYVLEHSEMQFFFNITQFLRNVPFIALTFTDETFYDTTILNANKTRVPFPKPQGLQIDDTGLLKADNKTNADLVVSEPNFVTGVPELTYLTEEQRKKGGFFSLPPYVRCEDLKILLGESAFPLTQVPMSWDDMYMYNRKHFEMYGRDFNIYRVSPIGRAYSGDASFFFDLSHSPMAGFQIGPGSPLQIMGKILKGTDPTIYRINVTVTCYYSNNFNAMLASGGVVPLQ